MDCTLFTYRNLEELRKIQEEREVFAFIFGETKDMLDSCSDVCIDISALVYFLLSNKNNIELTYINFTSMAEDTVVIAEAAIVENAIELLPLLFSGHKCYFEEDDETETFKLVTTVRGNSLKGMISIDSPIGKAILGHRVNDRVTVKVNDGYSYDVVIKAIANTVDDGTDSLRKF